MMNSLADSLSHYIGWEATYVFFEVVAIVAGVFVIFLGLWVVTLQREKRPQPLVSRLTGVGALLMGSGLVLLAYLWAATPVTSLRLVSYYLNASACAQTNIEQLPPNVSITLLELREIKYRCQQ